MKLTKSKLKQLIKEELSNIEEAEITPEEFEDLRTKVDPETFDYREEMEAIKDAMQGLKRDILIELGTNINRALRTKIRNNIDSRQDDIKKALISIVSKKTTASEPAEDELEL